MAALSTNTKERLIMSEKESESHIYFVRSPFSTFAHCRNGCAVKVLGKMIAFKTAEHAYQALKAAEYADRETLQKIVDANYPTEARQLGQNVKGYDAKHWDAIRYDRALTCQYAKFTQSKHLEKLLLETGDKTLVYASKNKIWGIGLDIEDVSIYNTDLWTGTNLLGRCLIDTRHIIMVGK